MQGDWNTSADDFRHHEVDPGANRASCRLPGRPAAKEEARYAACYRIAVVSTAPLMPGTYSCLSGTRTCSWQMRSQPEQTRRGVSTAVISACSALHDLAATEGMFDVWWLSVNIHPLQCHFLHCAFLPCPPALLSLSFWHDAGNGKFRGSTFESHTITKDLLHSTLMR